MHAAIQTLLLVCLLAGSVAAQELAVLGEHSTQGVRDGRAFRGVLEIRAEATYWSERVYTDGRRELAIGIVRVDGRDLVLTPGKPAGPPRRFKRADTRDLVRWEHRGGGERIVIDMGKKESTVDTMRRALERGRELHYLTQHNRGQVDSRAGAQIVRMRQPTPEHLVEFKKQGGRTVLSLNGDQHKEDRYRDPGGELRKVNRKAFIQQIGLRHVWLRMSASRAPSDAELVRAFRVLLDDAQRPILLHCKGGADRTGVVGALYQIEFLGYSKARAKEAMRQHLWMASRGTEIQGVYVDLYQKGRLRALLKRAGVRIPDRYRLVRPKRRWF